MNLQNNPDGSICWVNVLDQISEIDSAAEAIYTGDISSRFLARVCTLWLQFSVFQLVHLPIEHTDSLACIGEYARYMLSLWWHSAAVSSSLEQNPLTCRSRRAEKTLPTHTYTLAHAVKRELGNRWREMLSLLGYIQKHCQRYNSSAFACFIFVWKVLKAAIESLFWRTPKKLCAKSFVLAPVKSLLLIVNFEEGCICRVSVVMKATFVFITNASFEC